MFIFDYKNSQKILIFCLVKKKDKINFCSYKTWRSCKQHLLSTYETALAFTDCN